MAQVLIDEDRLVQLKRSHKLLRALESGGVDNWEWYSEAYREAFPEEMDEEDEPED